MQYKVQAFVYIFAITKRTNSKEADVLKNVKLKTTHFSYCY